MRPVSSCLLGLFAGSAAVLIGLCGAEAVGFAGRGGGGAGHGAPGGPGALAGPGALVGRGFAAGPGALSGFGGGIGSAGGTLAFSRYGSAGGSTLAFSRYGSGGSVGVPYGFGGAGPYGGFAGYGGATGYGAGYGRGAGYGYGHGGYGYGYGGYGGGYGLPYGAYGGYPAVTYAPSIQSQPGLPAAIGIRDAAVLPPAIYVIGGPKGRAPASRSGAAIEPREKVAGLGREADAASVEMLSSGAKVIRIAPARP